MYTNTSFFTLYCFTTTIFYTPPPPTSSLLSSLSILWLDNNLQPNTLFYLNHGITGIFQEGAYQSYGSDLGPMKNYLMSKLLWDPINSNSTQIMKEFFTLYYGNHVGLKLQEYVKLWSKSIQANHFFLGESVPYTSKYLTPSNLLKSATFTLPDTTTTKIQAIIIHVVLSCQYQELVSTMIY